MKINKREKGKGQGGKLKNIPVVEIFTYGEYKLFTWTLLLHCLNRQIDLSQFVQEF